MHAGDRDRVAASERAGRGSERGHGRQGQNLLQRIVPGVDDEDIVAGINRHARGPA